MCGIAVSETCGLRQAATAARQADKVVSERMIQADVSTVSSMHVYEVRPRKDHRGVDLVSVVLLFGLWYGEPSASDFVIKKLPPHTSTMCRAAVLPRTQSS